MTEVVEQANLFVLEDLSPEILGSLHGLVDELLRVNASFNLTAVREPNAAWNKHIVDSLQALSTGLLDDGQSVVDLGSGAGFPALPLAVARPGLRVTALESTRKKCDFIQATAQLMGVAVQVVCERAETACHDKTLRGSFDVATARAVGSFSEVCELTLPLIRVGGHLILWRGQAAKAEVAAGGVALQKLGSDADSARILHYKLPDIEIDYHLVILRKSRPTPPGYPRRVGLPKQKPL